MNEIIDKINKLKAKAEGTTNEHEAEIFANKVHDLMMQHNLHQMDLDIPEETDIVQHEFDPKYTDPWRTHIITCVGKLFLCETITRRVGSKKVYVYIGQKTNCEVATDMAMYLINTTVMLGKEYSKVRKEYLGFERGCGTRLAQRVINKYHEAKRHDPKNPDNLPALYQSEEDRIQDWMGENLCLGKARRTRQKLNHHSGVGAAAAENVPIRDKQELA